MTHSGIALALLMSGCSGGTDKDSGDEMLGTCARPQYGLNDLSHDFSSGGCDVQEATGSTGPGANSYFYGVYKAVSVAIEDTRSGTSSRTRLGPTRAGRTA